MKATDENQRVFELDKDRRVRIKPDGSLEFILDDYFEAHGLTWSQVNLSRGEFQELMQFYLSMNP